MLYTINANKACKCMCKCIRMVCVNVFVWYV